MFLQIPTPDIVNDSIPSVKEELSMLKSLPADVLLSRSINAIVTFAINLAIAIAVFYIGRFIINKLYGFIRSLFEKRKFEASLSVFILSLVRMVLYFILIVTVIGILGIETSSFLAIFASAGVAIGMALSGTLQNFAGGVLILLLKPYKIGDYIEAQGYAGTVREIQIFSTIICTPDNKTIIIPNGGLSTGSVNNYSKQNERRVDWTIGISYGDRIENARNAILAILEADNRVQKTPGHEPAVKVSELAESSVNLKVTAWVAASDYWDVFYSINEEIYNQLPGKGINFPFPQLDVHVNKQ